MEWERITVGGGCDLRRMEVPGGWLVLAEYEVMHHIPDAGFRDGWDWRPALAFVPDPNHEWAP